MVKFSVANCRRYTYIKGEPPKSPVFSYAFSFEILLIVKDEVLIHKITGHTPQTEL